MKKRTYSKINKLTIGNLVILGSVLAMSGCGQSDLLKGINNHEMIEIEVAAPINQEQGEETSIEWEKLALLETNPTLRKAWDDTLGITGSGETKNGILYVNADGQQDPNNTLRVAIHNREFAKLFESEDGIESLATATFDNYADLDVENELQAAYMGVNGYFNLLPDATPNYCNPDSTLTRAEFMAMVMRASTPVYEISVDSEFATAVGQNDLNIYAQEVADYSYLDLGSKSLNNLTYNGTITRAEAMYLLASMVYSNDLANVDLATASFTDAKDGGNIAEEQKFIENATEKDYWKSYELTYAIQNPDGGLPTDLYKALVVAEQKGILDTTETRWDEGLTKSEAVEFIINAFKNDPSIEQFSAKLGTVEGYKAPVELDDTDVSNGAGLSDDAEVPEKEVVLDEPSEDENINVTDYTIEPMDDTNMFAIKSCNVRSGPSTKYDKVDVLAWGQAVVVNGKVVYEDSTWYVIKTEDGAVKMVSASLLSTTRPEAPSNDGGNSGGSGNQGGGNSGGGGANPPAPGLPPGPDMGNVDWNSGPGDGTGSGSSGHIGNFE